LTIYVSQGSAATDLRGGDSFHSIFFCKFFLNFTVKNNENLSVVAEVIVKIIVGYSFLRQDIIYIIGYT